MRTKCNRWRLNAITLEGFRGFSQELTVPLSGESAMLWGNNGSGKSTLAQGVQWILFGRFPSGVLANTHSDSFLASVGGAKKGYRGRVEIASVERTVVVERDGSKRFAVHDGDTTFEGLDATSHLESLLDLDEQSFVRVALLHQGKIRGLLLDDPRDRNAALDRLLGTDHAAELIASLRPKDFSEAAKKRRADIEFREQSHQAQVALLEEQLEAAKERARSFGFLNKHFTPAGLSSAYSSLWSDVQKIAVEHGVALDSAPEVEAIADSSRASRAITHAISLIRTGSNIQQELTKAQVRLSKIQARKKEWIEAESHLKKAQHAQAEFTELYGSQSDLDSALESLATEADDVRNRLKQSNALRQLLVDAGEVISALAMKNCPVCEKELADRAVTLSALKDRAAKLADSEAAELSAKLIEVEAKQSSLKKQVDDAQMLAEEISRRQTTVDAKLAEIVSALGLPSASQHAIGGKLDSVKREEQRRIEKLNSGVKAVESALSGVEARHAGIREGLLDIISRRNELAAAEKGGEDLKRLRNKDLRHAEDLDRRALQIEEIRKAYLAAREEIARTLLLATGPRAQELYSTLVRHVFFDQLQIETRKIGNKMDYTFRVASSGLRGSEREARLVLSDGQITATALGLFLALAEVAAHNSDFVFIDDPTQNLDQATKEAMAAVLVEVARKKQLIISTHDENFVSMLKSAGFAGTGMIAHLTTGAGSPKIALTARMG